MKFLCLHGAYGSASNFQVQLGPFIEAVRSSGSSTFKWIDGRHKAVPPPGFNNYFGSPPLFRFMEYDGVEGLDDMLVKIRDFPEGLTPEDTIRRLLGEEEMFTAKAVHAALDRLHEIIDQDPEIDGILGYSEGATTAATLVLEERRRFEEEGIPRRIKAAIFFAGWPPVRLHADNRVQCLLADECEDIIDVPTCHVVGCNDPYIQGAMALYGMCNEDTAVLFDHGKGHTVPRDKRTIHELATAICDTVSRAENN
ncbi:ef-hand calcium-binding domain-containing [Fusarium albosuccineum]|uniref:Ef-hand calcium-binding domain-containing n=1 Tax=Fusarium albosuccineum TaxID=1237068 RepID=A0A8H4PCY1_9HYPO|nr:ef-hand calcium-binding domain-containing [Fusarium albosuccineum]